MYTFYYRMLTAGMCMAIIADLVILIGWILFGIISLLCWFQIEYAMKRTPEEMVAILSDMFRKDLKGFEGIIELVYGSDKWWYKLSFYATLGICLWTVVTTASLASVLVLCSFGFISQRKAALVKKHDESSGEVLKQVLRNIQAE